MEEEKRNLIIFFAISILVMVGYPYFFDNHSNYHNQNNMENNIAQENIASLSAHTGQVFIASLDTEKSKDIALNSKNLSGIISTRGAKIDNILLKKYDVKQNGEEKIAIFGKKDDKYYAHVSWISDNQSIILPDENTIWKTDDLRLSEDSPVKLSWNNGNGLLFERSISVDTNFVLTITDVVKNTGSSTISLKSGTKINREFDKNSNNTWTSYEGPLGYIDNKLEEISYEDIVKKGEIKHKTTGGWFGITDKYWLVAFIPHQNANTTISYKHSSEVNKNVYRIESSGDTVYLSPNSEITRTYNLFVGAKEIKTLDMYEDKLGVKHFDLAIDFGYLYFLTKPLLYSLAFIKDFVGNMGLGILLLTLLIKLLLLPLANKSYRSMNRMKEIQPKIQELQKKYANDRVKLGQEVSATYQKEGVSPLGGCLPTLLQSPVLFALYKVLYISIEMRQAPFIWWIHDLSLPDPISIFNLCGLIPIDLPGFLQIGIWPLLMGLSMWWQQKMSPTSADPTQANMMLMMPIMFTFMFAQLPSGLVIYWTFSNMLSILQQHMIIKREEKITKNSKKSKDK